MLANAFITPRSVIALTLAFTCLLLLIVGSHNGGISSKTITEKSGGWLPLQSSTTGNDNQVLGSQPPESRVELEAKPQVALPEGAYDNLKDVQNSTLGFQKIFVLSLPGRSDKRDALVLSAYLSGLDIEFIDGVNGTLMSERAYPQNGNMREPGMKTMGCWRGHMDIYQKIVRERIQSAMIMEDDVDWDVMVKAQMTEFARGTRHLQKANPPMHSPYGDDWDLLTTGHCGVSNNIEVDQDYWVTDDDPTVVAPDNRKWGYKPNLSPPALAGNRSRIIFAHDGFYCLASYAVSLRGAARIIYDQAVLPYARGIDSGIKRMCGRHEYGDNKCIGAEPTIMGVHKPAGDISRDSDRDSKGSGLMRKVPESTDLIYPIRLNLGSLMKGETIIKPQFPTQSLLQQDVDLSTFQLPTGSGVYIKVEEYVVEEKKDS